MVGYDHDNNRHDTHPDFLGVLATPWPAPIALGPSTLVANTVITGFQRFVSVVVLVGPASPLTAIVVLAAAAA